MLFFDRKPGSDTPWTKELWIYDLRTNKHFTLKTNTLTPRRPRRLRRLLPARRPARSASETERFRRFTYDELVARDKASLDIFWLRDESLEDTDNLPAARRHRRRDRRGPRSRPRRVHANWPSPSRASASTSNPRSSGLQVTETTHPAASGRAEAVPCPALPADLHLEGARSRPAVARHPRPVRAQPAGRCLRQRPGRTLHRELRSGSDARPGHASRLPGRRWTAAPNDADTRPVRAPRRGSVRRSVRLRPDHQPVPRQPVRKREPGSLEVRPDRGRSAGVLRLHQGRPRRRRQGAHLQGVSILRGADGVAGP